MRDRLISIIIPIYNKQNLLGEIISGIEKAFTATNYPYEIIFIDDYSIDDSLQLLQEMQKNKNFSVYRNTGLKGKAGYVLEGFKNTAGSAVILIDPDLRYPLAAIPEMIKKLDKADIIVASAKKEQKNNPKRTFAGTLTSLLGKTLFGIDINTESGIKIFSREVLDTLKFNPLSDQTFNLEFFYRAKQAGFIITNYEIAFPLNFSINSPVSSLASISKILLSALYIRLRKLYPQQIPPTTSSSMKGAGMGYKKRKYITHTTLDFDDSAIYTLQLKQKIFIFAVLTLFLFGLFFEFLTTLKIIIAILSLVYLVDALFNFFIVSKSLTFDKEISVDTKEINSLNDDTLPIYSILCPLYKEAQVIPQFLRAIELLQWPKDKLDVLLLLEEDDRESIEKVETMILPSYVRVVVVPYSMPKTKPKACNFGLSEALGEYLVIYDAEDSPDPMQLKKAYLAFQKCPRDIVCLQAKLNYYNPKQNLLTRFFTAEYSLWFDVTLPGLQSLETSLPLGGTSNHFRTEDLKKLRGWDAFNVTEDADMGIRLFKKGYKTAIIDSTTFEEANSNLTNWMRQRSRWIKGYMQTYLVHMRHTFRFARQKGIHVLFFQLTVGGKLAFILLNPLLWLLTIAYFTLYPFAGHFIQSLYPSPVLYLAVLSLVFGNFMFFYCYMIGCAKRKQWGLIKYTFLIPFYWLLISIASGMALYQLLFKPHYWEKTIHGLRFKSLHSLPDVIMEQIIYIDSNNRKVFFAKIKNRFKTEIRLHGNYLAGVFYMGALGLGNLFNFLYSAYLGRVLSLEDFGLIGLMTGLFSLTSVIPRAFGATVGYKTGYLIGKYNNNTAFDFWKFTRGKLLLISIVLTILWVGLSPSLLHFFKTESLFPFLLFSPVLLVIFAYATDRGFLSSRLSFVLLGILAIFEPILKLGFAFLLVLLGLKSWAYTAIPFSVSIAFLAGWIMIVKSRKNAKETVHAEAKYFPKKYFLNSSMAALSSVILLNLDVILAKHYLSPNEAGLYSLISLVAKTIFFMGSFVSPFLIPLISRDEGTNRDSKKILMVAILGAIILAFPAVLVFGILGHYSAPYLFGQKAIAATAYLLPMSLAMLCFTISRVYGDYYLTKRYYSFAGAALLIGVLQIVLISFFHQTVFSFVYVMSFIWVFYLTITLTLHLFAVQVKTFENNMVDFFGLFKTYKKTYTKRDKLRILILNWRDTRHKWAGGAEVYIQELAKRWVKDGNAVTVFCGNSLKGPRNEIIDGVQIIRRGGFYTVYLWACLYYIFRLHGKFDAIIDSENGIPFFSPLYSFKPKFLLIHHVHQEVFRKSLKPPFSWLALFLEAKLMPLVYKSVQVVTVSPSSKEEILRHKLTKKEPMIVYNGVDLGKYKPGIKSMIPSVLYLGRLQSYKSLHILIKAAKKISESIPEVEFIIAGEGEERRKLEKYAENLGMKNKILFTGKVEEDMKIKLFQKAWVFVNPSFMEGWGITTIEANACGTPTVASNVPGLRDSINNPSTGFLVPYGDADEFANKILELITNENLRKNFSQEAIKWAYQFTWEKSAQSFYELIEKSFAGIEHELSLSAVTVNEENIKRMERYF